MDEFESLRWLRFLATAGFAGVASFLREAQKLLASKAKTTRRQVLRAIVEILTVATFGGLIGWALIDIMPNLSIYLIMGGAFSMGYGGSKVVALALATLTTDFDKKNKS